MLITQHQLGTSAFAEQWTMLLHQITARDFLFFSEMKMPYIQHFIYPSFTISLPDWLLTYSANDVGKSAIFDLIPNEN